MSVDWPLSAAATLWCFVALFAGYAVRGATGFGSGIVATPLMAFVMPLATVAPLVTFLGLFVSFRQALRDWHAIAWRHLAAFVPGIAIGVPLGIWVFHAVDPGLLLRLLGAYVVVYALYSLLAPRLGYPLALVLTFAAVVAISALSYRIAELPAQRWARKLTARDPAPGAAPRVSTT